MTARTATWALAGAGSVALHGGALLLLAIALIPRPMPETPMPPTEVTLSADKLRRTRANAEAAEARPAEGREARGEAIGQDAPRRTEARAASPAAPTLAAEEPVQMQPQALSGTAVPGNPVTPAAQAVTTAAPVGPRAAPAQADVARGEALSTESAAVAAADVPDRPVADLRPETTRRPALDAAAAAASELSARSEASDLPEALPPTARPESADPPSTSVAALETDVRPLRPSQRRPAPPAAAVPAPIAPAQADRMPTEAASPFVPDRRAADLLTDVALPAEVLAGPSQSLVAGEAELRQAAARDPSADTTRVARVEAEARPVGASPRPAGPPAAAVAASGAPARLAAPDSTAAGLVAPDRPAASETPAGTAAAHLTAALAWQVGDTSLADPVSIAAVQAFMQPEAAGSGKAPVRDALEALLTGIPCARLQTEFVPETATLELRGHIPEDGLRAPLLAALAAQMGSEIRIADEMRLLPPPQCNALSGIAAVGLPQSEDQRRDARIVGANAHVREYRFDEGQRLELDLQAPDYDAYLYVDYFDADGNVLHLQPNDLVPLAAVPAKSARRVGSDADGAPALDITIGPPFGQEIAVAFATSRPLFDEARPLVEPAGPYLDFLRARVSEARAAETDFKGEWVYFFIATGPAG